eukprot:1837286-Alexandrium_andersonii.AAC.1
MCPCVGVCFCGVACVCACVCVPALAPEPVCTRVCACASVGARATVVGPTNYHMHAEVALVPMCAHVCMFKQGMVYAR